MQYSLIDNEHMEVVARDIVEHTCAYLQRYPKIDSLIIGISGGADSALILALSMQVQEAMLSLYSRYVMVIGRSLPITTNKPDEIDRAVGLGRAYDCNFAEITLDDMFLDTVEHFGERVNHNADAATKIRQGNIKARIRMMYLYNLAQTYNGMVMSTDNFTEYLLGFWTLHGDVGDFGMLQNLWKTEVFALLEYMASVTEDPNVESALLACRHAVPTDGLGISESDVAQFGEDVNSYEEVDTILIDAINTRELDDISDGEAPTEETHPIIKRFAGSCYKRDNPYNIERQHITSNI